MIHEPNENILSNEDKLLHKIFSLLFPMIDYHWAQKITLCFHTEHVLKVVIGRKCKYECLLCRCYGSNILDTDLDSKAESSMQKALHKSMTETSLIKLLNQLNLKSITFYVDWKRSKDAAVYTADDMFYCTK